MGKKRQANDDEYDADPPKKQNVVPHLKNQEKRLIVILEGAQLESVKVRLMVPCTVLKIFTRLTFYFILSFIFFIFRAL